MLSYKEPEFNANSVTIELKYSDMNYMTVNQSSETRVTTEDISISKLTPELIRRAEVEVNEKENWKERDIQALREIVLSMTSLDIHCN